MCSPCVVIILLTKISTDLNKKRCVEPKFVSLQHMHITQNSKMSRFKKTKTKGENVVVVTIWVNVDNLIFKPKIEHTHHRNRLRERVVHHHPQLHCHGNRFLLFLYYFISIFSKLKHKCVDNVGRFFSNVKI